MKIIRIGKLKAESGLWDDISKTIKDKFNIETNKDKEQKKKDQLKTKQYADRLWRVNQKWAETEKANDAKSVLNSVLALNELPNDITEVGTSSSNPEWYLAYNDITKERLIKEIDRSLSKGSILYRAFDILNEYQILIDEGIVKYLQDSPYYNHNSHYFTIKPEVYLRKLRQINTDSRTNLQKIKAKLQMSLNGDGNKEAQANNRRGRPLTDETDILVRNHLEKEIDHSIKKKMTSQRNLK